MLRTKFQIFIAILAVNMPAANAAARSHFKELLEEKLKVGMLQRKMEQQPKVPVEKKYEDLVAQSFSGDTMHFVSPDRAAKECLINKASLSPHFVLKRATERIVGKQVSEQCEEAANSAYSAARTNVVLTLERVTLWMQEYNITFEELASFWWDQKESVMFFSVLADFVRGVCHIEPPSGMVVTLPKTDAVSRNGEFLMPEHLRAPISKTLCDRKKESISLSSPRDVRLKALRKLGMTESDVGARLASVGSCFSRIKERINQITQRLTIFEIYDNMRYSGLENLCVWDQFLHLKLLEHRVSEEQCPYQVDVKNLSPESKKEQEKIFSDHIQKMISSYAGHVFPGPRQTKVV